MKKTAMDLRMEAFWKQAKEQMIDLVCDADFAEKSRLDVYPLRQHITVGQMMELSDSIL